MINLFGVLRGQGDVLGLMIAFTSGVNHVPVLICGMVPREWCGVSNSIAPRQLLGRWAGNLQAAQRT